MLERCSSRLRGEVGLSLRRLAGVGADPPGWRDRRRRLSGLLHAAGAASETRGAGSDRAAVEAGSPAALGPGGGASTRLCARRAPAFPSSPREPAFDGG